MLIFKDKIMSLVEGFFRSRGAAVEAAGDDLLRVSSAPGLEEIFEGRESVLLAFSPVAHRLSRGAVLVTPGSPLLRKIAALLKSTGLVGEGYLPYDTARLDALRLSPPPVSLASGCIAALEGTAVEYRSIGRFLFVVTIGGEETREEILPVYYDLSTGREMPPGSLVGGIVEPDLQPDPPREGQVLPHISLKEALPPVEGIVGERVAGAMGVLSGESARRCREELERLAAYYHDLEARATGREEKEEVARSFGAKKEEIVRKHSPLARAELANALLIHAPCIRYRYRLKKGERDFFIERVFDCLEDLQEPIRCPHCGKETERLDVCPQHGPFAGEEGWTCPVCGSERCSQCDYFECAVDGRKKDPECTVPCQFCQGRAGKDCLASCGRCRQEGCTHCVNPCSQCGTLVCPDCGTLCAACGKTFCREHMTGCDFCPSFQCPDCAVRACSACGKTACHQHSFICPGCQKPFCKSCMGGEDAESGQLLCRECSYTCPACRKTVRKDRAARCAAGGEEICALCARKCHHCQKDFCREHVRKCPICSKPVCGDGRSACPACGGEVCREHLSACSVCGLQYCQGCLEDAQCRLCAHRGPMGKGKGSRLHGEIASKDPEIAGIKKWECSEGAGVFVFYGEGFLKEIVVAADKETGRILGVSRKGMAERIGGLFSRKGGK